MFGKVRLLTKVFVDLFLPNYCFSCDKPHSNKYECLCDEWWTFLSPDHGNNWIDNPPYSSHLSSVYSGWYFNKVLQPVVHEIKYNGYAKIGLTLGKIMGAQIKNTVSQLDYLIPVPLIE